MVFDDAHEITILPRNSSTLIGMFYTLEKIYGIYGSRYKITGKDRNDTSIPSTLDCIDKYEHSDRYWSVDNYLNLTFTFDSPFLMTHYSIANAVPTGSNSHPIAWKLYGKYESGPLHMIDERTNQNFADGKKEIVKTFSTTAKRPYKEFVWIQSSPNSYVHLKHFEFFGTLCRKRGYCNLISMNPAFIKRHQLICIIHALIILVIQS